MRPLDKWLATQPKEFVDNVNNSEILGNGYFTVKDLAELDKKFNPEDKTDDNCKS